MAKKNEHPEKQLLTLPELNEFIGMIPAGTPDDIVMAMREMLPDIQLFKENLSQVRLYRLGLAGKIEDCYVRILNHNRKIVGNITKIVNKIKKSCQVKILEVGEMVHQLESANHRVRDELERMRAIRESEKGVIDGLNIQNQDLSRQLNEFYQLMQRDVQKQLKMVSNFTRQKTQDPDKLFMAAESLAQAINEMGQQHSKAKESLKSMNNLIKAMVHNTKNDAFTQVQQSQLQWKAVELNDDKFQKKVSMEEYEQSLVNLNKKLDKDTEGKPIEEQLGLKSKQVPLQMVNLKKSEKPWNLPASIVLFIQNMSKENQNGRVLPWSHVKKCIYEMYSERCKDIVGLQASLVGNRVSFEQYFILYFLKKQRMRRLSQIKVLQFLISIKYYAKFWPKAEMFAHFLHIYRYQPSFEVNDTNNYPIDLFTQTYFFFMFERMYQQDLIQQAEGTTLMPLKRFKAIYRRLLFFSEDLNRSRLLSRVEKTVKTVHKRQYIDFDFAVQMLLDQYFLCRKRNLNTFSKGYAKITQSMGGNCSVKELLSLTKEVEGNNFVQQSDVRWLQYPCNYPLQVHKLYLFCMTSGKNKFDINPRDLLRGVTKYGFDSPFPSVIVSKPQKYVIADIQEQAVPVRSKSPKIQIIQSHQPAKPAPQPKKVLERVNVASQLFSQHFAILKELREYQASLAECISAEASAEKVKEWLQAFKSILDRAVWFLSFPLMI